MLLLNLMTLLVGVVIFCAVFFVLQALFARSSIPPARLAEPSNGNNNDTRPLFSPELAESLAAQIPQLRVEAEQLELELRRAGNYRPSARRDFLAFRAFLMILVVLVTAAAAVIVGPENVELVYVILAAGVIVLALAYSLPRLILVWQGNRRIRRIERGLPDALDMITMCVVGGLSLRDALLRVASEIATAHPDLAVELEIVRQQAEIGTLDLAFKQFAQRVDLPEVRAMASLITQTHRLGTNVATALRDAADSLRGARRQRADEAANRTSVKMLFPVVLCLMPAVFLILWGPAIVEMRSFLRRERQPGGILDQPRITINEAPSQGQEAVAVRPTPGN
ncbi:MAG: type II secretion system F family protein [Pirellulales bacterium]|nr:type II secretion system F family protein [Pirellulales bacterium]